MERTSNRAPLCRAIELYCTVQGGVKRFLHLGYDVCLAESELLMRFSVAVLLFTAGLAQDGSMQLIIVDPGHFHASLLQKEMYPALAPRVSVYAPLGPDVLDYLSRVSLFNSRKENPTRWEMDVHLSAEPM